MKKLLLLALLFCCEGAYAQTSTFTPTVTLTKTPTPTPTNTLLPTRTPVFTATFTKTPTPTFTATKTNTPANTPTSTITLTPTPTVTKAPYRPGPASENSLYYGLFDANGNPVLPQLLRGTPTVTPTPTLPPGTNTPTPGSTATPTPVLTLPPNATYLFKGIPQTLVGNFANTDVTPPSYLGLHYWDVYGLSVSMVNGPSTVNISMKNAGSSSPPFDAVTVITGDGALPVTATESWFVQNATPPMVIGPSFYLTGSLTAGTTAIVSPWFLRK